MRDILKSNQYAYPKRYTQHSIWRLSRVCRQSCLQNTTIRGKSPGPAYQHTQTPLAVSHYASSIIIIITIIKTNNSQSLPGPYSGKQVLPPRFSLFPWSIGKSFPLAVAHNTTPGNKQHPIMFGAAVAAAVMVVVICRAIPISFPYGEIAKLLRNGHPHVALNHKGFFILVHSHTHTYTHTHTLTYHMPMQIQSLCGLFRHGPSFPPDRPGCCLIRRRIQSKVFHPLLDAGEWLKYLAIIKRIEKQTQPLRGTFASPPPPPTDGRFTRRLSFCSPNQTVRCFKPFWLHHHTHSRVRNLRYFHMGASS